DCAVFGIPDEEYGEALAAYVEPQEGATLTADAVRAWLRERTAGYKVPRLIRFERGLPREDSGKIFKRKLRAPYWEKAGRQIVFGGAAAVESGTGPASSRPPLRKIRSGPDTNDRGAGVEIPGRAAAL